MFALAGRLGRGTNSPPQFGHLRFRIVSAQEEQNVHSNEQMRASAESGGKSRLQHSQCGRSCNMSSSWWRLWTNLTGAERTARKRRQRVRVMRKPRTQFERIRPRQERRAAVAQ